MSEPGIFNDVIGPVMRGPSSSHTAASCRIGRLLRDLAGTSVTRAIFEFHPGGSLATTHETQGSDLGLAAGIIGMDITDPEIPDALKIAADKGVSLEFMISDYPAVHPNTYKCTLHTINGEEIRATALSTGGGMIELIDIQGYPLSLYGDFVVLFTVLRPDSGLSGREAVANASSLPGYFRGEAVSSEKGTALIIRFTNSSKIKQIVEFGESISQWFRILNPVLPVPGYIGSELPFTGYNSLAGFHDFNSSLASGFAIDYESALTGLPREDLNRKMAGLLKIWRHAISDGLKGTDYENRLAGSQSPEFMKRLAEGKLIAAGPLNRMIAYSTALMEVKSSMGIIIAAPTAGSCGGLPGCLVGMADEFGLDDEILVRGFWSAGLVGLFISRDATFAAEVAGCQAETGAGAAMAAAGLVEMSGGTTKQAMDAASLALQNIMGLVCDPVANRVEIPCLGRNAAATANALASANMILGGIDPVIPLNEAIHAMMEIGRSMPETLRCTALGGLANTPTARSLELIINKNE